MDQINQVPTGATGATSEQNQPVQAPTQPAQESTPFAQIQTPAQSAQPTPPSSTPSPSPLSQLPSFAPKKSNVKLWAGVIGGILIVVIGAAMILGKTKTYKGSIRTEEFPSAASEEMLKDLEKIKQEAEQEQQTQAQLKSECESIPGARWNEDGDNSGCVFGKTEHPSAASSESQAIADKAKQEHPTGPTGVETKIDETGQHFLVAQAEMGALKSLCDSTPGARWNEAGDDSGCVFEGINFKNLQAFKTKVDQVEKQSQESGQKPLGAASDESQAIVMIAKIENASRNAVEAAEFVVSLLNQYPSNAEIQSANAKAQNAAATAMDALGFAKGETDLGILDTLLSKAELAASKSSDAKNAAQKAAHEEDAKKQVALSEPEPEPEPESESESDLDEFSAEDEIAKLKAEIEDLKDQLDDAKNDNDKTLINKLIAEIAALNSKIGSLGGQQVVVNVPEYKSAAPESECADPSFVYDPFKKKCIAPTEVGASSSGSGGGGGTISASSAEGKKGAMEIPEMWSDEVKTSTIETPEMWGDAVPSPAPKTGASAVGTGYGATIQGKTGPGVLLYPVFIAGANGLYYLLRRRRKNKSLK